MRRVAVFSTNFLEYSQTFVHEEVTHHRRYVAEVFCRTRMNAERFPFDLVHGHFGTGSLYAMPYAVRHRLPLVVTFHGYDVPLLRSAARFYPEHWPYALLARGMLERLTLGLCASQELLELLVETGVPRARLCLYHLGIDLNAFRRRSEPSVPCVVMVGRFVEKKGFDYGLRAFARATERGAEARLVLVGQGQREEKLRSLATELGIARKVHFAGILTSKEVAVLLGESSILMAPSVIGADGDRESGVIALKEASATSLPVIGTYHGGIPEIIDHGSTGFLVPERDVDALSDRLYELLTDAALRRRFGEAGREKMEREYDLDRQVDELETRYDEALALFR